MKFKILVPVILLFVTVLSCATTNSNKKSLVESIELYQEGEKLIWEVQGYSPQGFKVLWSPNPEPVYPRENDETAYYIDDPYGLEFSLSEIQEPGLYYVRIGEYIDGRIGTYSNEIKIEINNSDSNPLSEYSVKEIYAEIDNNLVKWKTSGYSQFGFKVVWSKEPDPVYPGRDNDMVVYVGDPYENTLEIHSFNGSGWYYVRVVEYRDGVAGVYSNQLKVYLD